jgi:hypothetical protein
MTWSAQLKGHLGCLSAWRCVRMERRYSRARWREHAGEMIGVLFAAADYDARIRAPKPAARALRSGQHVTDCATGAARLLSGHRARYTEKFRSELTDLPRTEAQVRLAAGPRRPGGDIGPGAARGPAIPRQRQAAP